MGLRRCGHFGLTHPFWVNGVEEGELKIVFRGFGDVLLVGFFNVVFSG
jgi:hypothetical protein